MDNKKRIVNLEYFREMMHICPRLPGQTFYDLPFEEEILAFLRFFGHIREIRKLIDVNINKLHQPWRSFAAIINNALAGKVQATIVCGAAPPKTKASVRKNKSSFDTSITLPIAAGTRLSTFTKSDEDDDDVNEGSDDQDDDDDHDDDDDQDEGNDVDQDTDEEGINSRFGTTSHMDVHAPTTVASLTLSAPTLTPLTIPTISIVPQAPTPPTTAPSNLLQDLLNFGSLFGFNHPLKTLEANFSEFVQTNQFTGAVSFIPRIFQRYIDQRMNEAVKVAIQIQSDRLLDEAQAKNEEFLKNLDGNIQKIIKEQVKEHVKVEVSKILPKIKKNVNEQLEAEVITRSSNSSKTSYVVAADLSEIELKKIIIKKWKATNIVTLKRRRDDDANKDEEPSARSDRGSKRRREGKEPESTSALKEKETMTTSKSTQGSKSQQKTASESAVEEEPMQTTHDLDEPSHQEFEIATHGSIQSWISELAKQPDSRSSFNELMDTPSLMELEFFQEEVYKATRDQLDWNNPEGQQYPHNLLKPLPLIPNYRGRCVIPFNHFINKDLEYLRGGVSSRKDDDKLYKFKEGDFKRLCIQYIEDMLLLLVQGKLTNLTVEECFAFNVSLRMFTRSIIIQRRVEDLQLGVESYQKKLNLTNPDTYRFDLKRKEAYIAYSNLRGFIYQNKDKQNRLMRIAKLHKFSDGTLNDVRTALDDRLKGIRIKYLPQTIWRKSDKEGAAAMIQAIDKQLKTKRIMRSLEKFVGRRLYEGDFRML
nr:hypothetical protein [Tanacetum cinerariifolium]